MNHIELHVEELTLHGFNPADRHRIGDAVERELTRLLTESGYFPIENSVTSVRSAAKIHLAGGMPAQAIGGEIARSVFGTLPGNPPSSVAANSRRTS